MKYVIKALEFSIIIALLTLSVITFNKINQVEISNAQSYREDQMHLAIVTDEISSYAYQRFLNGVETEVKAVDAVFEVYEIGDLSIDDIVQMLLITEVDGVVFRLSDNNLAGKGIDACKEQGIFTIVVGNDAPESARDIYIGTNKFNQGRQAATLAIEAIKEDGNIGVILGSEYHFEESSVSNNFIGGIQDVVSKASLVELTEVAYSSQKRAELIVDEMLDQNAIDLLICTDPVDVNRIIRVLVDRNRVGDIKVIASGDTDEIIDGIEKNVIAASIVENYEELGRFSVRFFSKLMSGEGVSAYINVPFQILDQNNLGIE